MSYLKVEVSIYIVPSHDRLSVKTMEGPQVWPNFMTSRSILSTYMKKHGNAKCLLGAKSNPRVGRE